MVIYCCNCEIKVDATLVKGFDVYPHRPDLADLPFWRCDACGNWVGCHHKTKTPTKPLGVIPTLEMKKYRGYIHRILDPLWREGGWMRKDIYAEISKRIGFKFHTSHLKTMEEHREAYKIVKEIRDET